MEKKMVIDAIKLALENMDQNYCKLSKKDYNEIEVTFKNQLKQEKYLERPIAYEFYHQLRKLIDINCVDFGGPFIQAEVNKTYQHCFENGKMPDFIIHIPDSRRNLAVIEFKLATRKKDDIKKDIRKIVKFKTNSDLNYSYGIEVLLGAKQALENRRKDINDWNKREGEEVIIIEFDTDSWKTNHSVIRFKQ
jgi:hypothetical protein